MKRTVFIALSVFATSCPAFGAGMSKVLVSRSSGPWVQRSCSTPKQPDPTVNGKYDRKLHRLHVPSDCRRYGSFKDYGYYPKTSYAGVRNLPAAYWVYHYPYWYLYGNRTTKIKGPVLPIHPVTPPPPRCHTPKKPSADANGKYQTLLIRLNLPRDCGTYGSFRDYGRSTTRSYAGHRNLPAAYWVYHYPYWYLWLRLTPKKPVVVVATPKCTTPTRPTADANGKYKIELKRLHVPRDCPTYGSFRDYGYSSTHSYAGHGNLPAGYWTYHYPYWYLWKHRKP